MIAARQIFIGGSNDMSKQALQNWLDFFAGRLTTFVDDTMEDLGIHIFSFTMGNSALRVAATLNALKRVTIRNCFYQCFFTSLSCPKLESITGTQQFQNSTSLTSVSFPELTSITDFANYFFSCTGLKSVNLGKVTSLPNAFKTSFGNCNVLDDVYIESMQSSTLLSYTSMMTPDSTTAGQYTPHQVVFHCADGDVVWSDNDNAWVKQTS